MLNGENGHSELTLMFSLNTKVVPVDNDSVVPWSCSHRAEIQENLTNKSLSVGDNGISSGW